MAIIDKRQIEECLYAYKYLPRRIFELELEMSTMMPTSPGSVLKMTGRPVAKTPMDTSITERWALIRADCWQAREIAAKQLLRDTLTQWQHEVAPKEQEILTLRWGKEIADRQVAQKLILPWSTYRYIRDGLIDRAGERLAENGVEEVFDLAVR